MIWGVTPGSFNFDFEDNQGAAGFTGLTLHATAPGQPTTSLTFAGFTTADLSNGRIAESSGVEPVSGSAYTYFHEVERPEKFSPDISTKTNGSTVVVTWASLSQHP